MPSIMHFHAFRQLFNNGNGVPTHSPSKWHLAILHCGFTIISITFPTLRPFFLVFYALFVFFCIVLICDDALCLSGPLDVADAYSAEPIIRAKNWDGFYGDRKCHGRQVRGICVFGVGDAPWLAGRRELFANKFNLTFEYATLDCLEQRHRNRTAARRPADDFDEAFYRRLPTVVHARKNGLP